MATVGDTIGRAIADVIVTFSDVAIARAEYGREYAKTAGHVEGGRALVAPFVATTVTEKIYEDSALIDFGFGVRFELVNRSSPEETVAGLQSELRKKFNPSGRTLQTAVAALSLLAQPIRATVVASVAEVDIVDQEIAKARTPGKIVVDAEIRAQAWVAV